jgi:hypothetical protein
LPAVGKSPEEWINQYVSAIIPGAGWESRQVIGHLEGISDWGVTLATEYYSEGELGETTFFYPWHRVNSLRLAREDELTTT